MNSRPQRLVTPKLVERKCEKCSCFLAIHNLEKLCSPCANQEKRKSWLSKSLNPSFVTSAEELAKIGIVELITINKLTAEVAIPLLLKSGVLPGRLRRYQSLLIQLVAMQGVSNSAVARKLNVTRWTVAAWRERLGIRLTKINP